MTATTEAASVVLARGPGSPDLYVVRRADDLRFFPGYHAFPGGKVARTDAEVPVESPAGPLHDSRRVAAIRELFEETGLLLARRHDHSFPPPASGWEEARRLLDSDRLDFGSFLRDQGLHLWREDLQLVGQLITPPFSAIRFDTTFYLAMPPPGQEAHVHPGELVEGRWVASEHLLQSWTRGECHIAPPALAMLQAVSGAAVERLPERFAPLLETLARGGLPLIWFAPGVQMLPLRTVGLPPSSYTNAYLVGTGPTYLLDPGAHEKEELDRLFAVLDARQAAGQPITAVVLTHHHPDHIGGANACAQRYGVPILAHRRTAALLAGQVAVTGLLDEGDRLALGATPDGRAAWYMEALHTPGHASGHLAFYDPYYQLMFAGDMVSMLSSVVIAPPDGDLRVYLASLQRLLGYSCRMLLPSHGGATTRVRQVLEESLAHRRRREEQLLEALAAGEAHTIPALARALYRGLSAKVQQLAELQVQAGLLKLEDEGRAWRQGHNDVEEWRLTPLPGD